MTLRAVVRSFSELCITIGVLIVLFVVYVLYWTGMRADNAADGEIERLQDQWADAPLEGGAGDEAGAGDADSGAGQGDGAGQEAGSGDEGQAGGSAATPGTPPGPRAYQDGKSFAVMYIPRFGRDWSRPVLQNTGEQTLRKGLGHYSRTAGLGQKGNFAVAGHRRTYGDPFKDFPQLRSGDPVVVTDGATWYTYTITKRPYRTLPSDTGVLNSVPSPLDKGVAPFSKPGRYLTLTTCDPEWGSSHRLIAWAHLDATQPVSAGKPDALTR
ncbi:class E sortase [Streptomyces iconiensis]|uniref:Class E sortase n=1 Tax=Streptomyces iconiensis TaxID=1384038 RepID=A0ABT6ZRF6_9ACTN|nr:class E sortase [Streptomyces iconiensis]MDJ1131624.1 class E sortase [Streptomyces iconiensis]